MWISVPPHGQTVLLSSLVVVQMYLPAFDRSKDLGVGEGLAWYGAKLLLHS